MANQNDTENANNNLLDSTQELEDPTIATTVANIEKSQQEQDKVKPKAVRPQPVEKVQGKDKLSDLPGQVKDVARQVADFAEDVGFVASPLIHRGVTGEFWDDVHPKDNIELSDYVTEKRLAKHNLRRDAKGGWEVISPEKGLANLGKARDDLRSLKEGGLTLGYELYVMSLRGELPPIDVLTKKETSPLNAKERASLAAGRLAVHGRILTSPQPEAFFIQNGIDPNNMTPNQQAYVNSAIKTWNLMNSLEDNKFNQNAYTRIIVDEFSKGLNPKRIYGGIVQGNIYPEVARQTRLDEVLVQEGARFAVGLAQYWIGAGLLRSLGFSKQFVTRWPGTQVGKIGMKLGIAKNVDEAAVFSRELFQDTIVGFGQEINEQAQRNGGMHNINWTETGLMTLLGSMFGMFQSMAHIKGERGKSVSADKGFAELNLKQEAVPPKDTAIPEQPPTGSIAVPGSEIIRELTLDDALEINNAFKNLKNQGLEFETVIDILKNTFPENSIMRSIDDTEAFINEFKAIMDVIGINPETNTALKRSFGMIDAKMRQLHQEGELVPGDYIDTDPVMETVMHPEDITPQDYLAELFKNYPAADGEIPAKTKARAKKKLAQPLVLLDEINGSHPLDDVPFISPPEVHQRLRYTRPPTIEKPFSEPIYGKNITVVDPILRVEHIQRLDNMLEKLSDEGILRQGDTTDPPQEVFEYINDYIWKYEIADSVTEGELRDILIDWGFEPSRLAKESGGSILSKPLSEEEYRIFGNAQNDAYAKQYDSEPIREPIDVEGGEVPQSKAKKLAKIVQAEQNVQAAIPAINGLYKQLGIEPINKKAIELTPEEYFKAFNETDLSTSKIIKSYIEQVENGQPTVNSMPDVTDPVIQTVDNMIEANGKKATVRNIGDRINASDPNHPDLSAYATEKLNQPKLFDDSSSIKNAIDDDWPTQRRVTKDDEFYSMLDEMAEDEAQVWGDFYERNGTKYAKTGNRALVDVADAFKDTHPVDIFLDDVTLHTLQESDRSLTLEDIYTLYAPAMKKMKAIYDLEEKPGVFARTLRHVADQMVNGKYIMANVNQILQAHGKSSRIPIYDLRAIVDGSKSIAKNIMDKAVKAGIDISMDHDIPLIYKALGAFRESHIPYETIRNLELSIQKSFGMEFDPNTGYAASNNPYLNARVRLYVDDTNAWRSYKTQAEQEIRQLFDIYEVRTDLEQRTGDPRKTQHIRDIEEMDTDLPENHVENFINVDKIKGKTITGDEFEYLIERRATQLASKDLQQLKRETLYDRLQADPELYQIHSVLRSATEHSVPKEFTMLFNQNALDLTKVIRQGMKRDSQFAQDALDVVRQHVEPGDPFWEKLADVLQKTSDEPIDFNKKFEDIVSVLDYPEEISIRLLPYIKQNYESLKQVVELMVTQTKGDLDPDTIGKPSFLHLDEDTIRTLDNFIQSNNFGMSTWAQATKNVLDNNPTLAEQVINLQRLIGTPEEALKQAGLGELLDAYRLPKTGKGVKDIADGGHVTGHRADFDNLIFDLQEQLASAAADKKISLEKQLQAIRNIQKSRNIIKSKLNKVDKKIEDLTRREYDKLMEDPDTVGKNFNSFQKMKDFVAEKFRKEYDEANKLREELKQAEQELTDAGYTDELKERITQAERALDDEVTMYLATIQAHQNLLKTDKTYKKLWNRQLNKADPEITNTQEAMFYASILPGDWHGAFKKLQAAGRSVYKAFNTKRTGHYSVSNDPFKLIPITEEYNMLGSLRDKMGNDFAAETLKWGRLPTDISRADPDFKVAHDHMLKINHFQNEMRRYFTSGFATFTALPKESQVRVWNWQQRTTYANKRFTPAELVEQGANRAEINAYYNMRNTFSGLHKFAKDWADINGYDSESPVFKSFENKLKIKEYAPLGRHGRYLIRGVDKESGDIFVTGFDDRQEAVAVLNGMKRDHPQIDFKADWPEFDADTLQRARHKDGVIDMQKVQAETSSFGLADLIDAVDGSRVFTKEEKAIYKNELTTILGGKMAGSVFAHRNNISGFKPDSAAKDLNIFVHNVSESLPKKLLGDNVYNAIDNIKNVDHKLEAEDLWKFFQGAEESFIDNKYSRRFAKTIYAWQLAFKPGFLLLNLTQRATMTFPEAVRHLGIWKGAGAAKRAQMSEISLYNSFARKMLGVVNKKGADRYVATKSILGEAIMDTRFHEDDLLNEKIKHSLFKQWSTGQLGIKAYHDIAGGISSKGDSILSIMGTLSEGSNRIHSSITGSIIADALAKEGRLDISHQKFVEDFTNTTQFVYGKVNRPRITRGTDIKSSIGYHAFIFRTFALNYYSWLYHNMFRGVPGGKKAALTSLGMFAALGGVMKNPIVNAATWAIEKAHDIFDSEDDNLTRKVIENRDEAFKQNRQFQTQDIKDVMSYFEDGDIQEGVKLFGNIFFREGVAGLIGAESQTFNTPEFYLDRYDSYGPADELVEIFGAPADFISRIIKTAGDVHEMNQKYDLSTKDNVEFLLKRLAPSQAKAFMRGMADNVVLDARNNLLLDVKDLEQIPKELRPIFLEYVNEVRKIQNSMGISDRVVNTLGLTSKKFARVHALNLQMSHDLRTIRNQKQKFKDGWTKAYAAQDREGLRRVLRQMKVMGFWNWYQDPSRQQQWLDAAQQIKNEQYRQQQVKQHNIPTDLQYR